MADDDPDLAENPALSGPPTLPSGLQITYDPDWLQNWYKSALPSNKLKDLPQFEQALGSKSNTSSSSSSNSSSSSKKNTFSDEVCLDYVYQVLVFCRSTCLTSVQSACLASLAEEMICNLQQTACLFDESFQRFSNRMRQHTASKSTVESMRIADNAVTKAADDADSANQEEGDTNGNNDGVSADNSQIERPIKYYNYNAYGYFFFPSEAKLIIEFVSETFFKHFSLYRCCVVKGLLQRPMTHIFRVDCDLEHPSSLFSSTHLKNGENLSEQRREKAAAEKTKQEQENAEKQRKQAEEAERDRKDKERIMLEQDGYHDPEMMKLLVPPEMRAVLEQKVTESENRIRNKLETLDPGALEEAAKKFTAN